jgi:type IV pilus assembly protein PilQ
VLRVFSDPKYSLEVKSRSDGSLTIIPSTDPTQLVVNDENFTEFKKLPMDKSLEKEIRAQLEDKSEEKAGKAVITKSDTSRPIDQVARSIESEKKYIGRLISLDLQDTDIDNALRIIAEVSNLNIIASEDVQGKVTLRLIDVPWDQALDVILKTNGLDMVQEGNVVRIAPVEKLRAERSKLSKLKMSSKNSRLNTLELVMPSRLI